MNAKILHSIFLILIIGFTACTRSGHLEPGTPSSVKPLSPEDVVRTFVEVSAAAKEPDDKRKIEALCAGEMKDAFEKMTDDAFRMAYLGNLNVTDVKINESKVDGDLAKIRYTVAVENNQGTDKTKEENEREVELVQVQGNWRIQTIRIKGSPDKIAFKNGMVF